MWHEDYGMPGYRRNVIPVDEREFMRMREEIAYYRARERPSLPMPENKATPKQQINKLLLLEDL